MTQPTPSSDASRVLSDLTHALIRQTEACVKLRRALEFYARRDNYLLTADGFKGEWPGHDATEAPVVMRDGGEIARGALE